MKTRAVLICLMGLLVFMGQGQASARTFLTDTAGMAAFFQFTGPTNLASNLLRNQFRVVETVGADYLIGSVACAGFEGDTLQDAKVYIDNDGWVVAYFPKGRPLSQLVDGMMDPVNRLDKVLSKIAFALGVDVYSVSYTHFQYQDAETITRIGRQVCAAGENSLELRLPGANTYQDQAWHLRIQNSLVHGWLDLDQRELGNTPWGYGSTKVIDGGISSNNLVTNAKHVLTVGISTSGWGCAYGELDLLSSGSTGLTMTGADWVYSFPVQPAPDGLISAAADVPRYFDLFLPSITRV